jgi:hypothetical protein
MSGLKKIFIPLFFLAFLVGLKYLLWNYSVSSGKLVGSLNKISNQGRIFKTWEGVLDEEGSDNLSTKFSIRDEKLAQELYTYEGKEVILYYQEHIVGFPRETKILVTSWRAKQSENKKEDQVHAAIEKLNLTMFCAFVGTLYQDKELYLKIKNMMKEKNYWIYKQYEKCNH